MKKVLMILTSIVIVLIISSRVYMHSHPIEPIPEYVEPKIVEKVVIPPSPKPIPKQVKVVKPKPKKLFKCDGREYCSQMRSYDEAKYFNDFCPNTKMDGDGDGIPCERQFGR